MNSITDIFKEINLENGSNYKIDILKKHKDNVLLARVLKMTYDRCTFTFGVTMKNVSYDTTYYLQDYTLDEALDCLEAEFATRKVTGNAALQTLAKLLAGLPEEDALILDRVIRRDQRINMGRTNINKVFKGLIVKPLYMRCGIFSKKTASKISFDGVGAIVQLKADGTYRQFAVEDGSVICNSRSGEEYDYPKINDTLTHYPDGVYIGELTVDGAENRSIGNGLINSSNPPHDHIRLDVWDYVTLEEYAAAVAKKKCTTPYHERFTKLIDIVGDYSLANRVNIIESHYVSSVTDAMGHCMRWMEYDLEGAILKDKDAIFRDGTSPHQLKMKLEIEIDVRITGFTEGRAGTVREKTFGAMTFETDDGMIKGRTSGFTDAELEYYHTHREETIGKIMAVTCNDITKGRDNDYYALSHPRSGEVRTDKTETDTLERALELKQMAMELS